MGRYMAFWKYEEGVDIEPQAVYEHTCLEEQPTAGLCTLPIETILQHIQKEFTDYEQLDAYNYESSNGSFIVLTTPQSVLFDCSWNMIAPDLNRLITIMNAFGCPFYDPQITTRFVIL